VRTNNENIFLSASIQKTGHQLLDHQCWVMGRDVLNAEGNLFCAFGFTQVRCPHGGMTQYELNNALGDGTHVCLWGFGTFFGNEEEGVFLGRNDFKPRRTLGKVELHRKEDPNFTEETSRLGLFLRGLAWFADYEQWVAQRMPNDYREQCLNTFPRRSLPGSEFAERWTMLANRIAGDQEEWNVVTNNAHADVDVVAVPSGACRPAIEIQTGTGSSERGINARTIFPATELVT
jgi:hypothetical protein